METAAPVYIKQLSMKSLQCDSNYIEKLSVLLKLVNAFNKTLPYTLILQLKKIILKFSGKSKSAKLLVFWNKCNNENHELS